MPAAEPDRFAYAVLRVVPRVERGEQFNAGVVLFCRRRGFLAARVDLDERRLAALAPGVDAAGVRECGSRRATRPAGRCPRSSHPSASGGSWPRRAR